MVRVNLRGRQCDGFDIELQRRLYSTTSAVDSKIECVTSIEANSLRILTPIEPVNSKDVVWVFGCRDRKGAAHVETLNFHMFWPANNFVKIIRADDVGNEPPGHFGRC